MSRRLRRILFSLGAVIALLLTVCGFAAATEPGILVGEERDQHPAVKAYAEAERALLEHHGIHAQSRMVTIREPALRVHVLEVPGEGTPLVLVHGGGGVASQWAPLVPELRGRHLFLIDRPGCGLTDGFDYGDVDLHAHAVSFVGSVLDALGIEKAVLVGNSMGGLWSLWYAGEHPERVQALVLSGCPALFLGTSAPPPMRMMSLPGLGQAMMRLQPGGVDGVRSALTRVMGEHAVAQADPAFFEAAARARDIPGANHSFRTLIAAVLQPSGANPRYAFGEKDLQRVSAPILLVWGEQDLFGPPSAGEAARALRPDIELVTFPGGHLPTMDDAPRAGGAIRAFLDTRSGPGPLSASP